MRPKFTFHCIFFLKEENCFKLENAVQKYRSKINSQHLAIINDVMIFGMYDCTYSR